MLGAALIFLDLFILLPRKRTRDDVLFDEPSNTDLTVALTAYNDESSIGLAVADFKKHPRVKRVIVVDNNSKDRTSAIAREAGAIVVLETPTRLWTLRLARIEGRLQLWGYGADAVVRG